MQEIKVLRKQDLQVKVCVVVGTRPGIIKFSPIIRELQQQNKEFFIVHTGQHYSYDMDKIFFDDLELPEPKYKLSKVKNERFHGGQTALMLKGLEDALLKEKPNIVLVGGDANTNLAGALAARKLRIPLGHIEAGLRSHDWRMPEEHNRVMIDHISDYLFAPTKQAQANLSECGIKGSVMVTGNTICDAVNQNIEIAQRKSKILKQLNLESGKYFLFTAHREETVDDEEVFKNVLQGLQKVASQYAESIVFPVHPRTKKRIDHFGLTTLISAIYTLQIIDPPGYLDFLMLLKHCKLVITDSGGIQEESCLLQVPCVTIRENTERPETVETGGNCIAGSNPDNIVKSVNRMLTSTKTWTNPFGEGASKKIVDAIQHPKTVDEV